MTDDLLLFRCGLTNLPLQAVSLDEIRQASASRKAQGLRPLSVYTALLELPETDEGEPRVRRIAADRQPALDKAVEALGRRAQRLRVRTPSYRVLQVEDAPKVSTLPLPGGDLGWCRLPEVDRYLWVQADTELVRLEGWTFCATIEHLGEDGNLLRISPAFKGSLPMAYRTDAPTCDHCHTRRRRAETFVLQHEDGRMVRIGRSCVRDFLGDRSADGCVALAEMDLALLSALEDAEGGGGGGMGRAERVAPLAFLETVALVIARIGWLSRGAARQVGRMGTADVAWQVLCPPPGAKPVVDAKGEVLSLRDITDAMRQDAQEALAWARSLSAEVDSDYLYNLRLVASIGSWSGRESGLGAAILMSYQKEQDRLNRLRLERAKPSLHLGTVGERFGVKGTKKNPGLPPVRAVVLSVKPIDGEFGLSTQVRMQAGASDPNFVHDLIWYASGSVSIVVDPAAAEAYAKAETAHYAAREVFFTAQRALEDTKWNWQNARVDLSHSKCHEAWTASPECASGKAALVPLETTYSETLAALQAARGPGEASTRPLQAGDTVDLVATVKAHTEYGDQKRKSTKLTRCALTYVPASPVGEPT